MSYSLWCNRILPFSSVDKHSVGIWHFWRKLILLIFPLQLENRNPHDIFIPSMLRRVWELKKNRETKFSYTLTQNFPAINFENRKKESWLLKENYLIGNGCKRTILYLLSVRLQTLLNPIKKIKIKMTFYREIERDPHLSFCLGKKEFREIIY